MAILDRSALDAARKLNNLPPLTDAEFASLQGNGLSDEEKAAQLEDQKKADESKKAAEENKKQEEKQKTEKIELSDDELLEIVSKKTGRKLSSFEEIMQPEILDKEKAAEERESEKYSWALKNKKFKPKDLENYIAASKDPKALVYNLRLQQAKKEDPTLDEKEFEEEFNEEFAIDADKSSRRYKNGQDTLNRIAESVLKSTYAPIYNLESEYSTYEQSQKQKTEQQNKIKAAAPEYKKTIDKVFTNLKKIKAQISESEEYEIDALDDSLAEIKEMMTESSWASQQILNGATEEDLQEMAYTMLLRKNFPLLANEVAKQYLKKHAAGTKGVLAVDQRRSESDDSQLSDSQKILKEIIKQNNPQPAEAN